MESVTAEVGQGAETPSTVRPYIMDANDTTPSEGNERTDHEPQTDGGTRRQFLGAAATAAALTALPTGGSAQAEEHPKVKDVESHTGATRTQIESGLPVDSSMEVKEILTDETEISITGYRYDDEPSEVEISIFSCMITSRLNCSPERARELADELQLAAAAAEGRGE